MGRKPSQKYKKPTLMRQLSGGFITDAKTLEAT